MNHFDMELTQRQIREYQQAGKKEKGVILSRYCRLTGVSRNLASKRFWKVIRNPHPKTFRPKKERKIETRGRQAMYTEVHRAIVKKAWQLSGEICGERLHPALADFLKQLQNNGQLVKFNQLTIQAVSQISEPTLKRIIARFPKTNGGKKSKGNSSLFKAIPIQAHFGKNANRPGFVEIDYVEHNGSSSSGVFAQTGSYVDVCLGWLARSAALGKNIKAVGRIHELNEAKLFHRVHEYHPDNARPILKLLLEKTLRKKPASWQLSRSWPYHKEDNGHVEQKNGDKVRKLVGYHRYDTQGQVELLNRLYQVEDLISNFFLPSQKLIGKVQDKHGRTIGRRHDRAKTAYQRLMAVKSVSKAAKKKTRRVYNELNLVELRQQSEKIQNQLFRTVVKKR